MAEVKLVKLHISEIKDILTIIEIALESNPKRGLRMRLKDLKRFLKKELNQLIYGDLLKIK